MNIIKRQANDFIERNLNSYDLYKNFIDNVKSKLWDYRKTSNKVEFIEQIIATIKIEYDKHLINCPNLNNCSVNFFYENVLFFLQEELEALEDELTPADFNKNEKNTLNETLQTIVSELNIIKLGQQITYDDLLLEFENLKDFYFLNKKNWIQLFSGKLNDMVVGGVISEVTANQILKVINDNYNNLING